MVDFNLNEGDPLITNDIDCIIQQIDILFDTTQGDLLGDITYGTDYAYLLYDLKMSADGLRDHMMNDLNKLDLMGFTPEINVYLMQGTERDIALIQVDLRRYSEKYTKTYKIT